MNTGGPDFLGTGVALYQGKYLVEVPDTPISTPNGTYTLLTYLNHSPPGQPLQLIYRQFRPVIFPGFGTDEKLIAVPLPLPCGHEDACGHLRITSAT